jgi:site-specific DNA-methyltransferase (adenine-specific)
MSQILIGTERQRSDMASKEVVDHVNALADELKTKPLLHPIVLRSERDKTLVAGECRLTACGILALSDIGILFQGERLQAGHIPVTYLGELTAVEYEEAELSENLRRQNLTWQQEAAAIARLHKLREQVVGIYGVGAKPKEGQTPKATATEVFKTPAPTSHQIEKVRESIDLLDHLTDPDVAKAKTQKEAIRIVNRKEKERTLKEMADTYVQKSPHTLHLGDCLSFMASLPDGSFDIILTDPPYGIAMGDSWDGTTHDYDDSFLQLLTLFDKLPRELYRLAGELAHAYIFCDVRNYRMVQDQMEKAGWTVWERPIIWYKGNIGAFPHQERGFRYTYECIVFANKGMRHVNSLTHDVICIDQIQNQDHPAAKPVAVYEHLLKVSARPGDKVFDPFAGGGTIFPAATKANCVATACELNPHYHAMAKLRIDKRE